MNQSSIDRGMFRATVYKTYKEEERRNGSASQELIHVPERGKVAGMRFGSYDHLDEDGLAAPGSKLKSNDVIIGKSAPAPGRKNAAQRRDGSTIVKHTEDGVVDAVMVSANDAGSRLVKSRVRTTRTPVVGDKVASRHGQKGASEL